MIVRYRERALLDIGELQKYIEERSPLGARNVLREIHRSIDLITEQPLAYQRTDNLEVRVKVVRRYRYKISTPFPTKERSRSFTYATLPGSPGARQIPADRCLGLARFWSIVISPSASA